MSHALNHPVRCSLTRLTALHLNRDIAEALINELERRARACNPTADEQLRGAMPRAN
jgi:hypothetical protein